MIQLLGPHGAGGGVRSGRRGNRGLTRLLQSRVFDSPSLHDRHPTLPAAASSRPASAAERRSWRRSRPSAGSPRSSSRAVRAALPLSMSVMAFKRTSSTCVPDTASRRELGPVHGPPCARGAIEAMRREAEFLVVGDAGEGARATAPRLRSQVPARGLDLRPERVAPVTVEMRAGRGRGPAPGCKRPRRSAACGDPKALETIARNSARSAICAAVRHRHHRVFPQQGKMASMNSNCLVRSLRRRRRRSGRAWRESGMEHGAIVAAMLPEGLDMNL